MKSQQPASQCSHTTRESFRRLTSHRVSGNYLGMKRTGQDVDCCVCHHWRSQVETDPRRSVRWACGSPIARLSLCGGRACSPDPPEDVFWCHIMTSSLQEKHWTCSWRVKTICRPDRVDHSNGKDWSPETTSSQMWSLRISTAIRIWTYLLRL